MWQDQVNSFIQYTDEISQTPQILKTIHIGDGVFVRK